MIEDLKCLWEEAFGDPREAVDAFFDTAYGENRCETIWLDSRLAAALYWLDCSMDGQKLAYVYAVATGKAFRGQGLCRKLMEKTHEKLKGAGYDGAVLVPQNEGLRAMYGKMGYEDFGGMEEISAFSNAAVPVREISAEEYAQLRRRFLPNGGVVQEGVTLRYLGLFGKFYAGENWVLVGAAEGETFRGMELLGDPQAAPGILGALGYSKGTFRIPGKKPFAMYHGLTEKTDKPGYFGLALD